MKLEDLTANAAVLGILSDGLVTVLSVCSSSAPKRSGSALRICSTR